MNTHAIARTHACTDACTNARKNKDAISDMLLLIPSPSKNPHRLPSGRKYWCLSHASNIASHCASENLPAAIAGLGVCKKKCGKTGTKLVEGPVPAQLSLFMLRPLTRVIGREDKWVLTLPPYSLFQTLPTRRDGDQPKSSAPHLIVVLS